jgi:hypothetical protein
MCSQTSAEGGGAGGGGGTNGATAGRILSSVVATTSTPMVSITPLSGQTITFTSTAPTDATVGGVYQPVATATSGDAVTFTVDPASTGCAMIPGGFVLFTAPGTCIIDADQPGDGNYWTAAPQAQQTLTIGPATVKQSQTISFTSTAPADAVVDGTYPPTASASSLLPVTLSIDAASASVCAITGGAVTFTAPGDCVIDADQPGNDDWAAAPRVQQAVTVAKKPQTIGFTSAPPGDATFGGAGYTPAADATSGLPVTFSIDPGSSTVCAISGGSVTFTGAGDCVIVADQSGDGIWAAATQARQTVSVGKAAQTITFTWLVPTGAYVGGLPVVPLAEATSNLPVTITVDPSAAGVCHLVTGVLRYLAGGECVIDANQAGDADWAPAPQAQQSFLVASVPEIVSDAAATLTIGKSGSAEIRAGGIPAAAITEVGPLPSGVTLIDQGDGTARLSGTPAGGSAGDYPITITATNRAGHATQSFTLTVVRQPAVVHLSGPGSATPGSSVTISVQVDGGDPPSGSVDLSVGGVPLGTVVLDGSGRAQLSTSALPTGNDLVSASYLGDGSFTPASGSLLIVVSATSGGGAGSAGALARTGLDLAGSLGAMAVLLLLGLAMRIGAARRRREGGAAR